MVSELSPYPTLYQQQQARNEWLSSLRPRLKELREQGLSQSAIAFTLNTEGYRTFGGALFDQPKVSRLLTGSKTNRINGGQ